MGVTPSQSHLILLLHWDLLVAALLLVIRPQLAGDVRHSPCCGQSGPCLIKNKGPGTYGQLVLTAGMCQPVRLPRHAPSDRFQGRLAILGLLDRE